MEFSKFIVPIFKGEEYSGTGFISNGLLITANHVVENKINYYFYFDKSRHEIHLENLIVLEESKDEWLFPNVAHDLFVCETDIHKSELTLSPYFNQEDKCIFWGYSFDEVRKIVNKNIVEIERVFRSDALTNHYGKLVTQKNCLSCLCNLVPGNSGGVLIQNNQIIGMLIKGFDYNNESQERSFIKSDYIIKAIDNSLAWSSKK